MSGESVFICLSYDQRAAALRSHQFLAGIEVAWYQAGSDAFLPVAMDSWWMSTPDQPPQAELPHGFLLGVEDHARNLARGCHPARRERERVADAALVFTADCAMEIAELGLLILDDSPLARYSSHGDLSGTLPHVFPVPNDPRIQHIADELNEWLERVFPAWAERVVMTLLKWQSPAIREIEGDADAEPLP